MRKVNTMGKYLHDYQPRANGRQTYGRRYMPPSIDNVSDSIANATVVYLLPNGHLAIPGFDGTVTILDPRNGSDADLVTILATRPGHIDWFQIMGDERRIPLSRWEVINYISGNEHGKCYESLGRV